LALSFELDAQRIGKPILDQQRMIADLSMDNQILQGLAPSLRCRRLVTFIILSSLLLLLSLCGLRDWICSIYVAVDHFLHGWHHAFEVLDLLWWQIFQYLTLGPPQYKWRDSLFQAFERLDESLGIFKFF
jgi:hypothetical protein